MPQAKQIWLSFLSFFDFFCIFGQKTVYKAVKWCKIEVYIWKRCINQLCHSGWWELPKEGVEPAWCAAWSECSIQVGWTKALLWGVKHNVLGEQHPLFSLPTPNRYGRLRVNKFKNLFFLARRQIYYFVILSLFILLLEILVVPFFY